MLRSENAYGVMLLNLAVFCFVVNDAFMKLAFETIPFSEAIGLRSLGAVVVLGGLAWRAGAFKIKLSPLEWRILALRGTAEFATTTVYLIAVRQMALADVTAIYQALPLVLALGAVIFYGEKIGWRRQLAIAVGFIGVLIMLRPGAGLFNVYMALPLLAVFFTAVRDLTVRQLRPQIPGPLVAFVGTLPLAVLFVVVGPIAEDWKVPNLSELGILAVCTCGVLIGYIALVTATRHGDISVLSAFRYLSLIWAVILGMVMFAEYPDWWMVIGAVLVVGSGLFMLLREAQLRTV